MRKLKTFTSSIQQFQQNSRYKVNKINRFAEKFKFSKIVKKLKQE